MRGTLKDDRIDLAARRRGGLVAAWMVLTCGLLGGAGATQNPPHVMLHNRLAPRALGRVLAPAAAAPLTHGEAPTRAPQAVDLASGLGDPVCAAASVAWDGQPLPDGEQGTLVPFAFFRSATINEVGRIAFFARVDGADRNQGIFTADANGLRVVALGCGGNGGSGETAGCGDPAPVGGTFSGFFLDTHLVPDINDDGDVLFFADIHEGDAPRGLFLYHAADDTIEKVAAVGDTLPEGGVIAELGSGNLNNEGRVVFAAKLAGKAETDIFLWDGTTVSTYVAAGDPAPGGGVFTLLISESFGYPDGTSIPGGPLPGFDDQGRITFRALVAGGEAERGIFLSQDGEHEWLVRAGDPAPEGGTYISFEAPLPNDSGDIAFFADIEEGDSSTTAWIAGSPGNWRRAITAFEPIGDAVVSGMAISRNPMSALNDQGDLVLWINRTFPDQSTAGAVIVSRADGERVVIAGQGEPTPQGGTYGSFDAWPAMNDAGQVRVGAGTPGLPGQTNTDFVLTLCGAGSPALAFDPLDFAFGDVEVGTTSPPQTAMLQNTGDADATGVTFSGLPASGFEADTSACGDTLPVGESCAISVSFTPAEPGPATATLHVDSTEGATADLGLSGNGVEGGEPPVIDVDPDSLASTLPEGGTESQPLTIANLGDETLEWEVTEDGATGARRASSTAHRPSGAASGARARRTSRTVMTVTEQGVFEATDATGPAGGAAASFAPAPVAGPAGLAQTFPLGTTLWTYDDEDAIADGVAVDATNVWGAWTLNGVRLSAHPILGDGTPAIEFSSFDSGTSGVVAAQGADRIAFMESNAAGNDFRLHAFTSASENTPDWSFQFPVSDPNLPASSRKLAVSHDGSTIAAVVSDSVTLESTLYVFDAATGEVTLTWTDDLRMDGVDLTDDGSIALVAETNLATVLDTTTGDVLFQTAGSGAGAVSYRISGDGSVFVVDGFDFDVYRHDGTTYQQIIHFTRPSSWFGGASAVSRDGSTVGTFASDFAASWLEGEVYLFDVASGELIGSHPVSGSGQFQGSPSDAASSDDGSVVAFASWGTEFEDWPEVMVFNRDVELIGEIAFPGSAFSVDVSADGQYVVGGAKAVHANEFGSGGRIELTEIEGGEPADCVLPEWVSVDPTSGTVPAGGEQIADVTFDATGLDPDIYTANLCLASNDPTTSLVEIPLTLTVEDGGPGGPIADITPESFSFEVPQGGSDGDTLNVGNAGDADLTWSLAEAEAIVVPEGAPYRHGLADTPEFHAPVGTDRATRAAEAADLRAGRTFAARSTDGRHGGRPLQADARVLPAPQPAAVGSFTEGFDDITQLPGAGWALINNSDPVGPSSWFQGNETIFLAHEGDPDAYIAANFESTDDVGTISNWLLTPEVTIVNGTTITFWTRKAELFEQFADRLEVRMSVAGDSTDVGDTAESVGDFTEVLLTINPDLIPGEYPQEWTQFTLTVRGRSREPVTGRFALRYWVTDAGPNGTNGDYIGIDTVSVTQPGDVPPGGCDDPVDIPWLSADPVSGTTAPGASEPVTVTVDATDLEAGDYAAQLCVTTNDPAAPLVKIPVLLSVTAGSWVQEAKLTTSDGTLGDLFALVVAIDGDTALVGAPFTTVGDNTAQGAVYVFVRDGGEWVEQTRLVAIDGAANHFLGFSVALAGDTALIGAIGAEGSHGAAYVFTRDGATWSEQARLTAAEGVPNEQFGGSVAVSGDSALVGASGFAPGGNTNQGAAYVFTRDGETWSEQTRIVATDGTQEDFFGARVALSGDTALIGASFADVDGRANQGAAYVFTRADEAWSEQAKLTAADGVANDNFGISAALDGDTALLGAWTATVGGNDVQGAAYVFTRDGASWSEQAKLVASDGAAGDSFGVAVSLSGDAAVVGAHGADPDGSENEGAAYVFARDGATWSEQAKLVIDDGIGNEGVGGAVALSGGTAVVGAPIASPGAAYVFGHGALRP